MIVAIICFFVVMSAQGLIGPNGGALASAAVPDHPAPDLPSSASSNGSPLAPSPHRLGDEHTAVPMATLMIAGAAASKIGFVLAQPAANHADQQTPARSTPP